MKRLYLPGGILNRIPLFVRSVIMDKIINQFHTISKSIRLLWRSSAKCLIAISVFNILAGSVMPINMLIWKNFLNSIVVGDIKLVIFWLGIYGGLVIINDILVYFCNYFKTMQVDYTNLYITNMVLNKTTNFEMKDFDDVDTYNQISMISREALSRTNKLADNLMNLVKNMVTIIGTVGILLSYSVWIVIIAILSYIPIFLINITISQTLYEIYGKRVERLRLIEALKNLMIKYENVKELKIFKSDIFIKKMIMDMYNEHISEDKKIRLKNLGKQTKASSIQYLIAYGVKIYIVVDSIFKKVNIGSINMYINSVDIFQQSLGDIIDTFANLYNDNLYVSSLFLFMDKSPTKLNTGELKFDGIFKKICFKNVWFRYPRGGDFILKDINLVFEAKKSYMIVGLNGSGKTTLIKLLTYLYLPTKGKITIDDVDIKEFDPENYRDSISTVFQDFIKYPIDIAANIKIGDYKAMEDDMRMKKAASSAGLEEFILGLPQQYKTKLQNEWKDSIELSLGQWQRLAIARAAFSNKPIIIMDEPTASLDAQAEDGLFSNIKNMVKNKTCILISHRLVAAKDVDYIYVLKDSRLAEEGNFKSLMAQNGEFKKLYHLQAKKFQSENYQEEV